ncbi:GL26508 [Drosophila persimilis]|uniref:GL26508 n=1 Tax=Drosophila persimilis TaxID=7234 RepID=B4GSE2_DROPE|nr:GL26508 [Drosophila persimilis]
MNALSAPETATVPAAGNSNAEQPPTSSPATPLTGAALGKPNDWVVIPVFADIVKLALGERENCLQRPGLGLSLGRENFIGECLTSA